MSYISSPIKPGTVVLYSPQKDDPIKKTREKVDAVFARSLHAQMGDRRLHPSSHIQLPRPTCTRLPIKAFQGTRAECCRIVQATVHRTIDNMDYDGLKPYTTIIDQMEKREKPRDAWTVEGQDGERASTCVGMSLALQKNIEKLGIEGSLAVEVSRSGEFGHAAIIVECSDGLVFIDNRSVQENRLFSIPFNSTFKGDGFSITALPKGSLPPLILDVPGERFRYYTHIENGADLVSKQYMFHATSSFIPVAVYKKDGSPLKDVIVKPSESRIRLMDYRTQKKDYITFEEIRTSSSAWKEKLKQFMGSDFHITHKDLYKEIVKFACNEFAIKKLFIQSRM